MHKYISASLAAIMCPMVFSRFPNLSRMVLSGEGALVIMGVVSFRQWTA